jgi:predicted DNA-binding transcriptional regulator AlpA
MRSTVVTNKKTSPAVDFASSESVVENPSQPVVGDHKREFRVISSPSHDADRRQHSSNALPTQRYAPNDHLLNAREVASKLGVSERWVRDHTTRRSPKIRAVKLGPLVRYRWADVEIFMESLDTLRPSRHP